MFTAPIPELLTPTAAARLIGWDYRTFRRLLTNEPGLSVNVGGKTFVLRRGLEALLSPAALDDTNPATGAGAAGGGADGV